MARIAVVGSVARDEVVALSHRLREGGHLQGAPPVPRLGGGGANTAVALAAAGETVSLVTVVGSDAIGGELLDQLRAAGVDTTPVLRVAGDSTRSLVLLDPTGERTIVNLTRAREPEPPRRLLDLPADAVYVRTAMRGMAPLLADAARRGPVVAHIPPLEPNALPVPVLVGSASDLDAAVLADPLAAGRLVAGEALRWVVITRGAAGAEAHGVDGTVLRLAAPRVEVVDSTGAGDAFAAGLVRAMARRLPMEQALAEAVRWGSAKVACPGSALSREAVRILVNHSPA